jgi:microcystin-dependent protein
MSLDGNSDETNGYYSVMKNGVVANANFNKAVLPPIGCVLSWLKTLTGCPALPDGFVECNGQTLDDADSPFDGVTIPDLNGGTYRMLRGASTSGGTTGSDTHTLTVDEIPAHTHTVPASSSGGSTKTIYDLAGSGTLNSGSTGGGQAHNNIPACYEVVYILRIK